MTGTPVEAAVASGRLLAISAVLLTVVVSGAVLTAVGEVYLRVTRPRVGPVVQRGRSLEYEATLFARSAFPQMVQRKHATPGGYVEINSRGYRGPEFALPKPADVTRIVMLGGSAVFDMYAKEGSDWPRLTERYLREQGFPRVEIINGGTPGNDTADMLGRFYAEIWNFQPDYVLVYESWNDIKYFSRVTAERALLRLRLPQTAGGGDDGHLVQNPFIYFSGPVDRFLSHSQLYARLRDRFIEWRLGRLAPEGVVTDTAHYASTYSPDGPQQYELNLRLIVAAARHVGAEPILATQARLVTDSMTAEARETIAYEFAGLTHEALVRAFGDCDRAVSAVANRERVPLLDLSARFTGRRELFEDHVHTTAAGSQALARATAAFLGDLLKQRARRPPAVSSSPR